MQTIHVSEYMDRFCSMFRDFSGCWRCWSIGRSCNWYRCGETDFQCIRFAGTTRQAHDIDKVISPGGNSCTPGWACIQWFEYQSGRTVYADGNLVGKGCEFDTQHLSLNCTDHIVNCLVGIDNTHAGGNRCLARVNCESDQCGRCGSSAGNHGRNGCYTDCAAS